MITSCFSLCYVAARTRLTCQLPHARRFDPKCPEHKQTLPNIVWDRLKRWRAIGIYIHTYIHTHIYIHSYIHSYTHTHSYIHRWPSVINLNVIFEVLTAVLLKIQVFLTVILCHQVNSPQRFKGSYCAFIFSVKLHYDDSTTILPNNVNYDTVQHTTRLTSSC